MKNTCMRPIRILLNSLSAGVLAVAIPAQPAVFSADSAKHTVVTLYANGGIVRQVFDLALQTGDNSIRIQRIPEMVVPSSLSVRCSDATTVPKEFALETPLTTLDLLQQYLGRGVTLRQRDRVVEGELIVAPTTMLGGTEPCYSGAVIRLRNGELLVSPCGELILPAPSLPLPILPTLTAIISARKSVRVPIEVIYQNDGLQWQASYDAVIDNERTLQLTGFVHALNSTRTTFRCDTLHLVAGTVHLHQRYPSKGMIAEAVSLQRSEAFDGAPTLETFDEYYLYTIPSRGTLLPNATTTVLLRSPVTLPYTRHYRVRGRYYSAYHAREEGSVDVPVSNVIEFANSPRDSQPLPAGSVRVWQRDSRGSLHLIGQDNIPHTPVGENVSLAVGNVFDIRALRREVDYKRLADKVAEYTVEYTLRNRKAGPVQVSVLESFAGDWEITASTIPWTKRSARSAEFIASVPAKGSTTFRYTVRHSW